MAVLKRKWMVESSLGAPLKMEAAATYKHNFIIPDKMCQAKNAHISVNVVKIDQRCRTSYL